MKKKANQKLFKVQQKENVFITTKYHANLLKAMSQKQHSSVEDESMKIENEYQASASFQASASSQASASF